MTVSCKEIPMLTSALIEGLRRVIIGADDTIRLLSAALLSGGHVLLEDLPGSGKTTLVKAAAILLGCGSKRIQGTPDLMPADITGYEILTQNSTGERAMQFCEGPVFTNLLLADEINRMAPRSQSGLLECMAEHQVTVGAKRYPLPKPFFVIATQNPIEMQGTFPLPEAQLDRFFMRLRMGRPDREQELAILEGRQLTDPLDSLSAVTDPKTLLAAQEAIRTVSASADVLNYLLSLAEASRKHPRLRCGLSTRAVLAVRRAAQASAAAEGRDHMIPDDIKSVFTAVCAHRFQVTDGLLTDREASEALAQELLDTVPVPKA
ncbi:MAG: MoxR family ATPase [Oscillospiraceae bacterium]|nr:MoxR family ATPase [Oscillospiraceae bacterium]